MAWLFCAEWISRSLAVNVAGWKSGGNAEPPPVKDQLAAGVTDTVGQVNSLLVVRRQSTEAFGFVLASQGLGPPTRQGYLPCCRASSTKYAEVGITAKRVR